MQNHVREINDFFPSYLVIAVSEVKVDSEGN